MKMTKEFLFKAITDPQYMDVQWQSLHWAIEFCTSNPDFKFVIGKTDSESLPVLCIVRDDKYYPLDELKKDLELCKRLLSL